jgi:hypothetical protein
MLSKCANPSCSTSFRHLAEGQLFRLETVEPAGPLTAKDTEYFWLCETCSSTMTPHLAQDGRVVPTALPEALRSGPPVALNAVDRGNGLVLRSVSFLRRSHPRGT